MSNRDEREINDIRADMRDISAENKEEIDLELVKSIEKLVEEETNVARASLGGHVSASGQQESMKEHTQEYNVIQMKTQILPNAAEIEKEAVNNEKKEHKDLSQQIEKDNTVKKKKQRQIVIAAAVILVAAAVLVIVLVVNSSHKKSYDYNYGKGTEFFEKQDYRNALQYFEKAYKTGNGIKNTDLMFMMYLCYMQNHEEESALNVLKSLLSVDKNNEKGLKALADFYYQKKDGEALNTLITDYKGTSGEKYLEQYEVAAPQVSEKPGEYNEDFQISLLAADNCVIYYTTDGTQPNQNSTLYQESISLTTGTNVIKAIAVDDMGVQSETVEFQYKIRYKQPETPVISPASGVYETGEKIVMEAEEGSIIYYTLDGTTPTTSSDVYTEPFDMPEGNTVVSAIAVNKYQLSSTVARKNYIVNAVRTYTDTEAVNFLKNRMKELNLLSSDGEKTLNGETAIFTYLSKIVAEDMEMYYIRLDLMKDGATITEGFYGVDVKKGQCYKITGEEGAYKAAVY